MATVDTEFTEVRDVPETPGEGAHTLRVYNKSIKWTKEYTDGSGRFVIVMIDGTSVEVDADKVNYLKAEIGNHGVE